MGKVKGANEYEKFQKGQKLTMKQAILANCYMCNGFEESNSDCQGQNSCALYPFSPYGRRKGLHSKLQPEHGGLLSAQSKGKGV